MQTRCPNPQCGVPLSLPDSAAHQGFQCPRCSRSFRLGAPASPTPAAAPAPTPAAPATPPQPAAARRLPPVWVLGSGAACAVLVAAVGAAWVSGALFSRPVVERVVEGARDNSGKRESGGEKKTGRPDPDPVVRGLPVLPRLPAPGRAVEVPAVEAPLVFVQLAPLASAVVQLRQLAGAVDRGKEFDEWLKQALGMVGTEGQKGLDLTRPIGLYVQPREGPTGNGEPPAVVLLVPVGEEKSFVQMLRDLRFKLNGPDAGGLWLVDFDGVVRPGALPPGVTAPTQTCFRVADGYAHVLLGGSSDDVRDGKRLRAEKLFRTHDRLFSATLRLDRVSAAARRDGLAELTKARAEATRNLGGAQRAFVEKAVDLLVEFATDVLDGVKELHWEVALDARARYLHTDLYLRGKPGSQLAAHFEAMGNAPSRFAGLPTEDAAASLLVNLRLPQPLRALLPDAIRQTNAQARQALVNEKASPKELALADALYEGLGGVLAGGELDIGVASWAHGKDKPSSVAWGVKVPNGPALDRLFRRMVETDIEKKEHRDLFELDARTIGTVKVHRLHALRLPFVPATARLFHGDNPIHIAFAPDAACFSGGADGVEALRRALQTRPQRGPLFQVAGKLLPMHHGHMGMQVGDLELAERIFKDQPGRFRLELSAGDALRLHYGMDLAMLRFIVERLPPPLGRAVR